MSGTHGPLHQFEIQTIVPLKLGHYDISFTNSSLFMLLTLATLLSLFFFPFIRARLIPGRWQALAEICYSFVGNMVKENIGHEGKMFFPFVFSLFMFIAVCNIFGMMPYSFTVTSHIIVTFALALCVFLTVVGVGFARHGLHFFSILLPKGTPWWLAPLMIVIELFTFLSRPVTLSIRLAANMMAGHILLKVIASFVVAMGIKWGWIPIPFMVVFVGFELFVALLQAYIFTILACAYLNDAVHLH